MKIYKLIMYLTPYILAVNLVNAQTTVNLSVVRCGAGLVRVGETKLEVMDRCGEPRLKETVSGGNQLRIEQWLYKPKGKMTRILTFQGTVLIMIERVPSRG